MADPWPRYGAAAGGDTSHLVPDMESGDIRKKSKNVIQEVTLSTQLDANPLTRHYLEIS